MQKSIECGSYNTGLILLPFTSCRYNVSAAETTTTPKHSRVEVNKVSIWLRLNNKHIIKILIFFTSQKNVSSSYFLSFFRSLLMELPLGFWNFNDNRWRLFAVFHLFKDYFFFSLGLTQRKETKCISFHFQNKICLFSWVAFKPTQSF